ncbi:MULTISPECIES: EAL and HDOD domain-containing protein [Rhodanobacter]|uniref:EAL and HDOD domain-containing protein n=1 Tax=Rhodanobacter TaxID=75309 RepID=UPI0004826A55|nr:MULTISPECIES: HDOD domain-containing protein [Rhodanobacter]TAN16787.1 MAG: HDOD domain-containing protein [Rhodanobacter sp.]UJJ54286.1 HDOD domain-containing protein [Rhodanobacter thiooxydans]
MSQPNASSAASPSIGTPGREGLPTSVPLPVLRVPMLDRERQLFAYEIVFHREPGDEQTLLQCVLSTITDGALTRLVRGNRAFLNMPAELLPEDSDVLLHQPRLGVVLLPHVATDAPLMKHLQQMAQRGCQFMLDVPGADLESSLALETLLQMVQLVRLDASHLSPERLKERAGELHQRGIQVVAGHVNDHLSYERCLELPLKAIQGRYLLIPQPVAVPVLTANRLSMLRLMRVLQESNPGPVELGNIVRDDAVLSYKLLSCVNSAYFALPRQLKSVQQAAIFFGVMRMRNWIDTMSMCSMDDRPPELLRAALIRAHMCEELATGMPNGYPEMAFTVGLFSLLDTLMCAPMEFLLTHLRLVPEISDALTGRGGPFAPLLKQILAWEAGELTSEHAVPQRIQRMATIYLGATQWADQVFASADGKSATA